MTSTAEDALPVDPDAPRDAVSSAEASSAQAALRADIRALGSLLGETLVRQEGQELFDLVERVRAVTRGGRGDDEQAAALLDTVDLPTATRLVRAFATYFQLANVTEQVHRGRELAAERERQGGWLARTVDDIVAAGLPASELQALVYGFAARPVVTAHPT